jgi:hypothetical protein
LGVVGVLPELVGSLFGICFESQSVIEEGFRRIARMNGTSSSSLRQQQQLKSVVLGPGQDVVWVDTLDVPHGEFFALLDNIGILLFRLSHEGLFENWVPSSQKGSHKYEFRGVVCDIDDLSPRVLLIPSYMYTLNNKKTVSTMRSSIVELYIRADPKLTSGVGLFLVCVDSFYSPTS